MTPEFSVSAAQSFGYNNSGRSQCSALAHEAVFEYPVFSTFPTPCRCPGSQVIRPVGPAVPARFHLICQGGMIHKALAGFVFLKPLSGVRINASCDGPCAPAVWTSSSPYLLSSRPSDELVKSFPVLETA